MGDPPSAESIDSTRDRWIQFLALGTIAVAALKWRNSVRRRTTDPCIAALDLLGAETGARRVAGVYALEQMVREDHRLHAEVVDILAALVREVARDPGYKDG